jgi:hypothetical protein
MLIYNAGNYEKEEEKLMVSSLGKLLSKNMIYFQNNLDIPSSPKISNFYLEKMFGNNEDLAQNFLGKNYKNADGIYSSDKGRLKLDGDEFKFYNNSAQMISDLSEDNVEEICRNEMRRLGILSDLYVFSGINYAENGIKAIFTVQHNDSVFFDAYISFELNNNGISVISGKNIVSDLNVVQTDTNFYGIISILPDLAENALLPNGTSHTIVNITSGYYIGQTAESYRNILAIPVWQVATDSGIILYYDARNGQCIEE